MDNNTNQNAIPEIKTEEVTKKEKPKKEKIKKEKAPKEPMDKQDQLCYFGAMVFFILALLPFLLRSYDPSYNPDRNINEPKEEPKEVSYIKLNCNKYMSETGYKYLVETESIFADQNPKSTTIKYTVTIDEGANLTLDQIDIPEYTTLMGLNENGISGNVNENVYVLTINYETNPELKNNAALDSHNKIYVSQKELYSNNGFQCMVGDDVK